MTIIITGSTGMVGSAVLSEALADKEITQVIALGRKAPEVKDPKLRVVLHTNFLDYSGLDEVFRQADAVVWCLGISQNQVSEEQYIQITYDYTVAAAKTMLAANPNIGFLFLSGDGASSEEKSRFLFGRVKGRTENALLKMPFKRFFITRPAGILPVHYHGKLTFALRMQYLLVRIFQFITPAFVIRSTDLARALLHIIKHSHTTTIADRHDLKQIAKSIP